MGLETFGKISDLNTNWPLGSDPKSQGDDHIRGLKVTLTGDVVSKQEGGTFDGAVSFGDTVSVTGTLTASGALAVNGNLTGNGDVTCVNETLMDDHNDGTDGVVVVRGRRSDTAFPGAAVRFDGSRSDSGEGSTANGRALIKLIGENASNSATLCMAAQSSGLLESYNLTQIRAANAGCIEINKGQSVDFWRSGTLYASISLTVPSGAEVTEDGPAPVPGLVEKAAELPPHQLLRADQAVKSFTDTGKMTALLDLLVSKGLLAAADRAAIEAA